VNDGVEGERRRLLGGVDEDRRWRRSQGGGTTRDTRDLATASIHRWRGKQRDLGGGIATVKELVEIPQSEN
jgi:hypothetical protein